MTTSELTGALLDYWVAKAEGLKIDATFPLNENLYVFMDGEWIDYEPSSNWAQGGPIIDRERPHALESCNVGAGWYVRSRHLPCDGDQFFGETLLIAAMRAYVASKFGEEVPDA